MFRLFDGEMQSEWIGLFTRAMVSKLSIRRLCSVHLTMKCSEINRSFHVLSNLNRFVDYVHMKCVVHVGASSTPRQHRYLFRTFPHEVGSRPWLAETELHQFSNRNVPRECRGNGTSRVPLVLIRYRSYLGPQRRSGCPVWPPVVLALPG